MNDEEIKEMQRVWSGFTPRLFGILESRDDVRGVLFISQDDSGRSAARRIAEHIADDVIVYGGENENAWRDKTLFLRQKDKYVRTPLIEDGPEYVSIVIDELDAKPDWFSIDLMVIFDQSVRPCRICASARDERKIPDTLRSRFHTVSKLGRPRKT